MMTDCNIVVDEDGYDYYDLDSRSRMMFLKLLFKVKISASLYVHTELKYYILWIVIVYFPVYRVLNVNTIHPMWMAPSHVNIRQGFTCSCIVYLL